MKKYLVILTGIPRGGDETWNTLFNNVLSPLKADLAICTSDEIDKTSSLYQRAKHKWLFKEYDDWFNYWSSNFKGDWREVFNIGADTGLSNSGSVHFAIKDIIRNNYLEIIQTYDYFIYTRFDQFYVTEHPAFEGKSIWIPRGEDYMGVCDRHAVLPTKYADQYLNICNFVNSSILTYELPDYLNCEVVYKMHLEDTNLSQYINRYERFQFTTAKKGDFTRWRVPKYRLYFFKNILIKYPDEFLSSIKTLLNQSKYKQLLTINLREFLNFIYLIFRKLIGRYLKSFKDIFKSLDVLLIVIFNIALLIKVVNTELTYDEAYTFLNYVITDDILNIGIANNHLLNTFLVWLTTQFSYSELSIRLPNLLSGIIYSYFVYNFLKNKKNKYLGYSIFLSNPFMIDFFTLSRGYGLSVNLIFLSTYFYVKNQGKKILIPLILISFATFSYHPILVFFIVFLICNARTLLNELSKIKFIVATFVFANVVLLNSYILFNITSTGKPLYGIKDLTFFNLAFDGFGFEQLYLSENLFLSYLLKLLFYLPVLISFKLKSYQKNLVFVSYSSIILVYLIPFILDKPYPLLRTLLPFIASLFILFYDSLVILLESLKKEFKILLKVFIILTLTINTLIQVNLSESIQWKDSTSKTKILQKIANSCEYVTPLSELGPVGEYYRLIEENVYQECTSRN